VNQILSSSGLSQLYAAFDSFIDRMGSRNLCMTSATQSIGNCSPCPAEEAFSLRSTSKTARE
jgi:hypothetical protein